MAPKPELGATVSGNYRRTGLHGEAMCLPTALRKNLGQGGGRWMKPAPRSRGSYGFAFLLIAHVPVEFCQLSEFRLAVELIRFGVSLTAPGPQRA